MEASLVIHEKASNSHFLRQGEIITDLQVALVNWETKDHEPKVDTMIQPYSVLLTQDCDLEQDSLTRDRNESSDRRLPFLLFCEVFTAEDLFGKMRNIKRLWEKVAQNREERFHFFQKIDAALDDLGEGLPELGIDFKRYFTLPTDEAYRQVNVTQAKRRCKLVSPYLEHFCRRFANYLSRIALPIDHESE